MYKSLSFLFFFLTFSSISIAQEAKESVLHSRVSFNYQPSITYRFLKASESQDAILLKNNLDSIESYDYGFSFGLNYRYTFKKHIGISLGVNYVSFREQTINGSIDKFINYKTTNTYFSIPLNLIYISKLRKYTNFHISAGVSQCFLNTQYQRVYNSLKNEDVEFETSYDLKKSILLMQAGLGVNFRLNKKFYFTTEVVYTQSIGQMNNSDNLSKSIYSFGPNFMFGYSF